MPTNDNAHALRLAESLSAVAGTEAAARFAQDFPLSKSASIEKKHAWAEAVCAYLDSNFDAATVRTIRKNCRCNDGKAIADKLRKYLHRAASLMDFVSDFNQHEHFAHLEYLDEGRLLFCYPQCYCACVKRVPGQLSTAWCACTLGNAEAIFAQAFGCEVRATLLESIKTGGNRCAILIEW